jgi:hypothetical protein
LASILGSDTFSLLEFRSGAAGLKMKDWKGGEKKKKTYN